MHAVNLIECCETDLQKDVMAADVTLMEKAEVEVMAAIKTYAVQSRAQCSLMTDLLSMVQDKPVRRYYARVQNVAQQCRLAVPCGVTGCRNDSDPFVSYRDDLVRYVVVNGLYHVEMKREVLGMAGVDGKTLAETIGLIEDKETAARSVASRTSTAAGTSTSSSGRKRIAQTDRRLKETGRCERCGKTFPNKKVR